MSLLSQYAIRHALSTCVALLIANLVNTYGSYSHSYWMILAALVMCQVTRGAPLRQSLIYLLIISLALISSDFILSQKQWFLNDGSIVILFLLTGLTALWNRPLSNRRLLAISLFLLIYSLAIWSPHQESQLLSYQLMDAGVGAIIGIVSNAIILPFRVVDDFYDGLKSILDGLRSYMSLAAANMIDGSHQRFAKDRLYDIQEIMLKESGCYPEWVYDVGFNRFLRGGFRYYLIVVDRMIELISSIELLLSREKENIFIVEQANLLSRILNQNAEILTMAIQCITTKRPRETTMDYVSDIKELETALQEMIPAGLELIEITPHFLTATALVRDMRDLRGLLLKLLMGLPVK